MWILFVSSRNLLWNFFPETKFHPRESWKSDIYYEKFCSQEPDPPPKYNLCRSWSQIFKILSSAFVQTVEMTLRRLNSAFVTLALGFYFLQFPSQLWSHLLCPGLVVVGLIKKTESGRCEGGASVNRASSVEPKVGATFSKLFQFCIWGPFRAHNQNWKSLLLTCCFYWLADTAAG